MKLQPYLTFDGQCREAFTLYQQVLGGEIVTMMRFGEAPQRLAPPDWDDKILHATFRIGDQELGGSDAFPGQYKAPQGIEIAINVGEVDEGKRIFAALAEGGTIRMAMQETFWSKGYGMLTDRFGIPWMINCG